MDIRNITHNLISAVKERVREIINRVGVSYSSLWLEGYAIQNQHRKVAEQLLANGSKVNSKNNNSSTALNFAVINGDIEMVEKLLDGGAKIEAKNQFGTTPLHQTVITGKIEIIELLLNRGANVDAKEKNGATALHIAVERNYLQIVKYLLKHGANVNAYTSEYFKCFTSLHIAVLNLSEEMIKLLLSSGANVNAKDKDGRTALYIAALYLAVDKHNEVIMKLLLSRGANVNAKSKNGKTALYIAAVRDHLQIVKELLKFGGDVNMLYYSISGRKFTLLHFATKNGHVELAKLLINCGADINSQDETGKTPMFYAIKNTNVTICKLLLTEGAKVKDNPGLLNIAVKVMCKDIVEDLLQHGADVNSSDKDGSTALHLIALYKKKGCDYCRGQIANLLLNKGANVNARTKNGITTLYVASQSGYVKLVEVLLAYNADVNSTDLKNDITPLHLSARKGNEEICKMLLNRGANINAKQKDGKTAFRIALERGHKEVVELLLECGAKFESKVKNDITPLHIVAKKNHYKLIEVLLKFGAEIDSKDEYGRTALHIAAQYGHIKTVGTLLKCGSDINVKTKNNHTIYNFVLTRISSFYDKCNNCYSDNNCNHNSDNDCDVFTRLITANILKYHIIKMKTANLFVSKLNLLFITASDEDLSYFEYLCNKEITSMKSEKVNNTNVLFYDILTKGINQLARYARNESIAQVLKSKDYKRKYPIYGNMINNHFKRGERRNELLEGSNAIFYYFSNNFRLPQECIENIFSFLSNEELRILKDAF